MNQLSGTEPVSSNRSADGIEIGDMGTWEVESQDGARGTLQPSEFSRTEGGTSAELVVGGVGEVLCRPAEPQAVPEGSAAVQVWIHLDVSFAEPHVPELVALLGRGQECSLGLLDFQGWHLLHRVISQPGIREFTGLAVRGLVARDDCQIVFDQLSIITAELPELEAGEKDLVEEGAPASMLPVTTEEVTNSIDHDGISYFFESRSLSAVVRFVYTPIEGTLSDIELELNNADPIKPAEDGGITVEMGGREWSSEDENIERHLVACEQLGECVEARWQWKCGEELADVLLRIRVEGKSLLLELEGGNEKATGLNLGRVVDAPHPRLIRVPYLNMGAEEPHILCTSGMFVSSLVDWCESGASRLFAPSARDALEQVRLNGGCTYLPRSDGRRNLLHERWVLTVSRQFHEVLPAIPAPPERPTPETLRERIWYGVPALEATEEAYVEAYEQLRTLKQWGMDDLLVLHPPETWRDEGGSATLTLEGAPAKGGDDALAEYLDALDDLGYDYGLYLNYRDLSPLSEAWDPERAARLPDGSPAPSVPGSYLLKPLRASSVGAAHTAAVAEKYKNPVAFVGAHAATPPWERVDCDSRVEQPARFVATLASEQALLRSQTEAHPGTVVGEGGSHWLYPGRLHGYLARQAGPAPADEPLLVDFDLRYLHPFQTDAGLGTPSEFLGRDLPADQKHSRSPLLDRYLAATVGFGHAGYLPDVEEWGLPAAVKTYYLLRKLQTYYLGNPVESIHYHYGGNLLETTEALISGAFEHSQVQITYANGLRIWVNASGEADWVIEHAETSFTLAPASFVARASDDFLAYSADAGSGRMDYAACPEYFYCDTRGVQTKMGPITLDGAALVLERKWQIDVYPMDCTGEIEVRPEFYWSQKRLPPLRLLAFRPDEDEPQNVPHKASGEGISFQPTQDVYMYRIALPEWMVEPGQ